MEDALRAVEQLKKDQQVPPIGMGQVGGQRPTSYTRQYNIVFDVRDPGHGSPSDAARYDAMKRSAMSLDKTTGTKLVARRASGYSTLENPLRRTQRTTQEPSADQFNREGRWKPAYKDSVECATDIKQFEEFQKMERQRAALSQKVQTLTQKQRRYLSSMRDIA